MQSGDLTLYGFLKEQYSSMQAMYGACPSLVLKIIWGIFLKSFTNKSHSELVLASEWIYPIFCSGLTLDSNYETLT